MAESDACALLLSCKRAHSERTVELDYVAVKTALLHDVYLLRASSKQLTPLTLMPECVNTAHQAVVKSAQRPQAL